MACDMLIDDILPLFVLDLCFIVFLYDMFASHCFALIDGEDLQCVE